MTTWSEAKEAFEVLMHRDPQRATLGQRAIASVEDGLQHLIQVGYSFEIAPRGTLAALVEIQGEPEPVFNPLSIKDAQAICAPPKSSLTSKFEALTGGPAGAE